MAVQNETTTIAEFETFLARAENRDRLFELINGEIVEKVVTQAHGVIAARIVVRLGGFVEANKLGLVMVEVHHKVPGDEHNERIPDIAFTSSERVLKVEHGAVPQMPDLAVEIKSPNDRYIEMREKAAYYVANGARMVWLIFPEKRLVEVYQPVADVQILNEHDIIEGGDVLPGFSLAVKDIFAE
jgi:Uma2 family endonuclease